MYSVHSCCCSDTFHLIVRNWNFYTRRDVSPSLSDLTFSMLEDIASNCSLRYEHIEALNISNTSVLMRLYNMCEHTWDPDKTWDVYYWEELLPPLFVYR